MTKDEAKKTLHDFYHKYIGNKSPSVEEDEVGESYYINVAESQDKSNKITIDLWFEDWKEKGGEHLSIHLCYKNQKMYRNDFGAGIIDAFKKNYPKEFEVEELPESDELCYQHKEKSKYYFAGIYINSNDEVNSLSIFFENETVKSIIERYVIVSNEKNGKITQRFQQILARVGQGEYREKLEELWNSACAVTGCNIREVLRASHAKPWKDCKGKDEKQRLDGHNGLLLSANYDALFDKGLISFSPLNDGWKIMMSSSIDVSQLEHLGINENDYLKPSDKLKREDKEKIEEFLKYHREHIFKN